MQALDVRASEVRALAIANQRETFVVTDELGKPLTPARVWMDARGRDQVKRAVETLGAERLHALSGKPLPSLLPRIPSSKCSVPMYE